MLPSEADAAVHLDAAAGRVAVSVGGVGLGDGAGQGPVGCVGVDRPGGVVGDRLGALDLQQHVRQLVGDRLVDSDRLAELLARLGVLHRVLEHLLGASDHLRAEPGRGPVERPPQRRPALVRLAHDRVVAKLDIVELDLVPLVGHIQRRERLDGHPLGLALDQEERHALLAAAPGASRDHHVVGAGPGHEELGAVEGPALARLLGRERHPLRVPAAGRFGERHRRPGLALGDGSQHLLLLGLTAGFEQRRHGHAHGLEVGTRQEHAAGLLEHHDQVQEGAEPAVRLGDPEGGPALLGQLLPELLVVGVRRLHELADHGTGARLAEQGARRRAQHLLLLRESKVHTGRILIGHSE